MKNKKIWSFVVAVLLLTLCVAGVLFTGTSAAEDVIEYKVNGVQFSSVKAALTAAEKEEWAAGTSLVIAVDPSAVASESITHDAGGQAYAGGIAFGQKTIFRADGSRLPITIKGGSDRAAFTLNITAGTKIACANSYTFQNLTLPLGNATTATHFYAGSGQVRLENVATGTGVDASIGADTFTARVFDGWGEAEIAANADRGKIKTSMTLGNGVKYVHSTYASRTSAVLDSDGWDSYAGVSLTPADTRVEFVVDGAEIGYFRGRLGTNPVAESIQRVETGTVGYLISCGAFNNSTTFTDRTMYDGDVTVIVNGGEMKSSSRLLHTAGVNGGFNVEINGGNFAGYFQPGYAECSISGDYNLKVTGGKINGDLYLHPSANVSGENNITFSGGTVTGNVYGTNGVAYTSDTASKDHTPVSIKITPNAKSADLDPVFQGDFYATYSASTTALSVEISGGTFKKNFYSANARANGSTAIQVSGGTFDGDFYAGALKGTHKSLTTTVSGGTFNGHFFGGNKVATKGDITNNISGGEFNNFFFGVGVTAAVTGNVTNNISGGIFHYPAYGGTVNAEITGTVTNNISGKAVFNQGYCAVHGTTTTGGITGAISNHIFADEKGNQPDFNMPEVKGLKFTYDSVSYSNVDTVGYAFLGGTAVGTVNGIIHNTVEAGTFGNTKNGGYYQGGNRNKSGVNGTIGKDANGVSVYNIIKGGTFYSLFGGGLTYGDTSIGEIRTVITGGVFKDRMTAGNRSHSKVNAPITMKITGGEFFGTVNATYFGTTEAHGGFAQVSTRVTLDIEGGVFHDHIYGLGNFGYAVPAKGAPGSCVTATGSVNVNVCGGVFYGNIFATNESPIEEKQKGEAVVTIEPKNGNVSIFGNLHSRFAAEKLVVRGGEYQILINANASIVPTAISGDVDFQQVSKWKDADFLILPEGHSATVNVSTSKGALGYFETELGESGEVIRVYGAPLKAGMSMLISDRITLKVQLSKTHVDAIENFAYSFKLADGTVLGEGTAEDLEHVIDAKTEFEYYNILLTSLGIDQFEEEISVQISGIWENGSFTVSTLAESAVVAWEAEEDLVLLAKSIVNLSKALKNEPLPYEISPQKVDYDRVSATKDADALVSFTDKHLLMDSAVGIRFKGSVSKASDAEDLTVFVNGIDVTDRVSVKVSGNAVDVDIFFSIYGVTKEFKLQILDRNGKNCLTMYERLDSVAEQYGTSHTKAQMLLCFMQAASCLEASTPVIQKANQTEIDALNSLYAGQKAYYGDIHSHPDGGHISDGNVHLTVWNQMREELGVDFYAAMNHRQISHLYDEGWDDTVFIAGSEPATLIDGRIDVHYNMFFPDAETFLEILELFPEFKYTGGKNGIDITLGEFGYPKFTTARFNELITAIKERGGMVVNVHPKQQHKSDDPLDYYFQDYMGLEVFYTDGCDAHSQYTIDNYNLWCDLLAMGKRIWATAGSDSHDVPLNTGLTTLYSAAQQDTAYLEKITKGDFVCGFAGIRMSIGEAQMGGHTDFAGKKLLFSVGDVFHTYLAETRMYRVNVITDQGVVATSVIDGTKTTYFAIDADENAKFYRIEVLDEEIENQPIIAIGNPIWND